MTKPLSSYPESERVQIAKKRASQNTGGIGWASAKEFLKKIEKGEDKKKKED